MNDIQRFCPQCQAMLEVPADSIGKRARCPACSHVFVIVANPDVSRETPGSPSPTKPPPTPLGSTSEISTSQPTSAPTVPPQTPPTSGRGGGGAPQNPYAPIGQVEERAPRDVSPVVITTAQPERYINGTWELFQQNWQPLIAAGAIAFAINVVTQVLGQVTSALAQQGGGIFILLNFLLQVLLGLGRFYVILGIVLMSLEIARGRSVTVGTALQTSPWTFVQAFLGYLVIGLPILLMMVPFIALAVLSQGNEDAMLGGLVLLGFLSLVVYAVIFLFIWPWRIALIDRQEGLVNAFKLAFEVAKVNKLNALILFLLTGAVNTVGICLCCVGQIASTPATILLASVAFLMMTGQTVHVPQSTAYVPPTSPPGGGVSPAGYNG